MAANSEDEPQDQNVFVDEDGVMWGEDELGRYKIDDKVWTMNEIRDHPMFMTDIPSDPRDLENYPLLTALQSVLYDDQSPEELAEHFRQQGNEAMKMQSSKTALLNALAFYTKGLEMECKDDKLNSMLHGNRALVSLKLGEHVKVVYDCRRAVRLDSGNLKAWFRGARASEALGLAAQGLKFCEGALKLDPNEAEVLRVKKQLEQRLEQEAKSHSDFRKKDQKDADARKAGLTAVEDMLAARGSRLGPVLFDMSMYRVANGGRMPVPEKVQDEGGGPEDVTIHWPLLLLYDEVNQSDFVGAFDERCLLEEQLQVMFPEDRQVEWDEQGKYVWNKLACYLEYYPDGSSETSLFQLEPSKPVFEALTERCLPPCLVIHVLVAGSPADIVFRKQNSL